MSNAVKREVTYFTTENQEVQNKLSTWQPYVGKLYTGNLVGISRNSVEKNRFRRGNKTDNQTTL